MTINNIQKKYGGSVFIEKSRRKLKPNSTYVSYKTEGKSAVKLIKDVRPFLKIKKRQAELCMLCQQSKVQHGVHNLPKSYWKTLESFRIKCINLNHKESDRP